MTAVRKTVLKRLGLTALPVLILILIGENKGPLRYLAAAMVLFIAYQVIHIVIISVALVDDLFPPKVKDEKNPTTTNKVIYQSAMVVFLTAMIAMIFESRSIDNTINGTKFFGVWALVGFVLYVFIIVFFKLKFPSVFDESGRRYSVYFCYFTGLILIVPCLASFINITYSDTNIECKTYHLNSKVTGGGSSTSYFLHIVVNGQEEQFEVTMPIFNVLEAGGNIDLCIKHGKLGYDFVDEFKSSAKR